MTKIALKNPYLVVVGCLVLMVLGYVSSTRIPVDLLPTFKTPAVQVLTLYPGMPAPVVGADITSRLERWTGQSNGIARQQSRSLTGVSVVRDYFREDKITLSNFIELGSMEAIKELVKIGIGAGVLAPWIARAELESGSLVSLPLGPRKLRRRWGVAHLRGRRLALAEETFVGLCVSASEVLGLKVPEVAA